MQFVEYRLL